MTAEPQVSVVLAAYNAEPFLGAALDSIAEQTFIGAMEVVVVDDGSTDATAEIVRRHRVGARLIQQANAGSAAARNRGIEEARGRYVAFHDADDLWLPAKLDRQLAALAETGARWAYTDAWFFDADSGETLGRWSDTHPMPAGDVARDLLRGNFLTVPTVLVERAVLERVGGFPETLPGRASISEDWALWLRIAAEHPIARVEEPAARIRRHRGRKTTTMDLGLALEARVRLIEDAVARAPERLGDLRGPALAGVHLGIARKHMERGEAGAARALLLRAIRLAPGHLPTYPYLAASLAPASGRRVLGRVRSAFRSLT
ncbi:MAG TPA: glycosyltransferase [Bacteroidetes bacterium]|nr:glycosyltransferase [Bacteroidota bacterium]HIL56712.1 glycosyltransferase [Rhodothermales bacterium]